VGETAGVPGLDLPGLNIEATAASYGVDAHEATDTDQLAEMLRAGVDDREGPTLVNVRTKKVKKASPPMTSLPSQRLGEERPVPSRS